MNVTNHSRTDLNLNINTSCGCTVISSYPKTLLKNESVELELLFDVPSSPGDFQQLVNIAVNDSHNEIVSIIGNATKTIYSFPSIISYEVFPNNTNKYVTFNLFSTSNKIVDSVTAGFMFNSLEENSISSELFLDIFKVSNHELFGVINLADVERYLPFHDNMIVYLKYSDGTLLPYKIPVVFNKTKDIDVLTKIVNTKINDKNEIIEISPIQLKTTLPLKKDKIQIEFNNHNIDFEIQSISHHYYYEHIIQLNKHINGVNANRLYSQVRFKYNDENVGSILFLINQI